MEEYLEDKRPTLDEICAETQKQGLECIECPAYEFCHNEWDE